MIDVVLWDNDGLLFDSEQLFFELTQEVFAEWKLVLTPEYWGREYLDMAKRSRQVARELGLDPELVEPMIRERDRRYLERLAEPVPLRPGVRTVLEELHGKVRMGVVTGSPRHKVDMMHQSAGIASLFEVVVTADDVTMTKPHPEPYLLAVARLRVDPERVLAVEDSVRGLRSAHAAGLRCVAVPNQLTAGHTFELATGVEHDVREVARYLGHS
ncbi:MULTISPECIES: HAD family hydrolase [Prosthecochloris]|uniref:HAD family phosphatase n=1 Tax=Prosthecochloris vibrioformis TaxID=1098 RepID=A0A5C4S4H1_PROVB|nr:MULTISPECIES: HAD family phosphatase [Prosthecochloris]ANT65582.1 Phosphorylated carbohydrates phosphatase [Prosthecochloris sp. CIB 2401]TNJ38037.1 HAD family phosphatase [Prosthecochloris vibrioformis]